MFSGFNKDTIVAPATAPGVAALAIVRISGPQAIGIVSSLFSKDLNSQPSHTAHFGLISYQQKTIDEVVAIVYKNPRSFTGEDLVEITCHGSDLIVKQIIQALLAQDCRLAEPGEFTQRAFANGKMDLGSGRSRSRCDSRRNRSRQASGSQSVAGRYIVKIDALRQELIDFVALIELELDFSEEDVDFADRSKLINLIHRIKEHINPIIASFGYGNAIKNGVPVVIAGKPNAGKSTLLNALLKEDKALVSDIAGTTRDTIEDTLILKGVAFRFADTAGLRQTTETIEALGIERAYQKISQAAVVIFLFDATTETPDTVKAALDNLHITGQHLIIAANKTDQLTNEQTADWLTFSKEQKTPVLMLSAAEGTGLPILEKRLLSFVAEAPPGQAIITNARHYNSLVATLKVLDIVLEGLQTDLSGDLMASDLREALQHLGSITGQIVTDDLLDSIFTRFCIGK